MTKPKGRLTVAEFFNEMGLYYNNSSISSN
jgi:hypothetical protein